MVSGFFTSPCDQLADLLRAGERDADGAERERVLRLLEEIEDVLHGDAPILMIEIGRIDKTALVLQGPSGGISLGRAVDRASVCGHDRLLEPVRFGRVLHQLDIEAEALELLDQHVERLGQARLERVLALDDRLVHPGAADHVVGLHRQELLQRVGSAVRLHGPDFHLAEPLSAELRLAAERLLGDQRVRSDRPGVDLFVDQVVELQHVHDADRDVLIEGLAGAAVEQDHLARARQLGELQPVVDLALARAVEHG